MPIDRRGHKHENHRLARHLPDPRLLVKRFFVPLLFTITIILATMATWRVLTRHEVDQISRIAEAESYAARSRLVRNFDSMLRALRDVQAYWSAYGHLPREQWASNTSIEPNLFTGVDLILWNDPEHATRYIRTTQNPVLDYRPTDDEWAKYQTVFDKAHDVTGEAIVGPFIEDSGKPSYDIYVVISGPRGATLVAVVDADVALDHLLKDDSPGYAITIVWADALLYERALPGVDLPASWTREGLIKNSMGVVWKVQHTPTNDLAESLRTPATIAVLASGVAIAILVGLLLFENGRARRRATAALAAERQVFELNRGLEIQIAQRTRELQDRSADLVTIADSVAHDLRNPLNSISVNAQLLEQQFDRDLGNDGMSIVQQISHCVRGMTEILERLLRLSIVSNITFVRERLDMRELVSTIFEELARTEPPPPVEFVLHEWPAANADANLVSTLLINLLSNALKYTRSRSARRVEAGSEIRDGCVVYFVKDNGIGFDSESTPRLFKAFERLSDDNDTTGLGLGLDIAARIISRHDGRIWAVGQPGHGAAFYFTLGRASAVA